MNFLVVIIIGAGLGVLDGVGIFFEPTEPYKWQILFAATLKGVLSCASYGVFRCSNYAMVVRDGDRRALWASLRSRDLSREGRSKIGRRAICDPKRNYHRRIDWPLHTHLGSEEDLTNR